MSDADLAKATNDHLKVLKEEGLLEQILTKKL